MADENGIVIDSKGAFSWIDADTKYRHKLKGKGKPSGVSEKEMFSFFEKQDKVKYEVTNTLVYGGFKSVDTVDGLRALEIILDRKTAVEAAELASAQENAEKAARLYEERKEKIRNRLSPTTLAELGLSASPPNTEEILETVLENTSRNGAMASV